MCRDCDGKGQRINPKDRCKHCNGKKTQKTQKILEVHVDKGKLQRSTNITLNIIIFVLLIS